MATSDACVNTCCASTWTEADMIGPLEPGTPVTLEGIVWHETVSKGNFRNRTIIPSSALAHLRNDLGNSEPVVEGYFIVFVAGLIVVNVTWRGKTYMGTLLDSAQNEWAVPRSVLRNLLVRIL